MVDHIYSLDSHKPYVFIVKFCNVSVSNGFSYLVLEGLFQDCGVFKNPACFAVCFIGLLTVSDCGICSYGWNCTSIVWVFLWRSHLQC